MGLHLPTRTGRPLRRLAHGVLLVATAFLLGACGAEEREQWRNLAMPEPATEESPAIFDLWIWGWVAAMAVGVIVWGLIFWVVWRYRQKDPTKIPVQTRYNLPLEIFYTIVPVLMVVVFFFWTVKVQDSVLDEETRPAEHVVEVVGQQWSWTFNYTDEDAVGGRNVYTSGTASQIPTLVLPVDETTRFNLNSPDVIHSFWVTGFLMKMDVIPGRDNHYQVTPTEIGEFQGKCAELCGVYHSRMLFNVRVVSRADFDAYLQDLQAAGFESDEPVLGGEYADTPVGLEEGAEESGDIP